MAINLLLALAVLLQIATLGAGYTIYTHLRFIIAALVHRASTDKLTDLLNREAADYRLSTSMAHNFPTSVAFIDVDNFKAINDTHGHQAGDAALRHIATQLTDAASPFTAARYSGDEFLIIFDGTGLYFAEVIADSVLRNLRENPFRYFGTPIPVSVSIGVAVAVDTSDPAELLRRADHAMYQAKNNGGMNVTTWTPGMAMPDSRPAARRYFRDAPTR